MVLVFTKEEMKKIRKGEQVEFEVPKGKKYGKEVKEAVLIILASGVADNGVKDHETAK